MLVDATNRFALLVGLGFTMAATAALPGPVALTLVEIRQGDQERVEIRMAEVPEAELQALVPELAEAGPVSAVRSVRREVRRGGVVEVEHELRVRRLGADDPLPPALATPGPGGLEALVEASLRAPAAVPVRTQADWERFRSQVVVEVEVERAPLAPAAADDDQGYRKSWFDGV